MDAEAGRPVALQSFESRGGRGKHREEKSRPLTIRWRSSFDGYTSEPYRQIVSLMDTQFEWGCHV